MLIEDGTGAGYKVKIDDENHMHVESIIASYQYHANHDHGKAYTMDIDSKSVATAADWLLALKNTDDDDLIVTSITLWLPAFKDTAIIEAYLGGTFTYASGGTAVVPCNLNAGSGNSASGSFYVNAGAANIATITAGSICGRYIFTTTPLKWEKGSGWIVPKNQCFMLRSDKDGEAFKGYLSFYYHNAQ